MEKITEVRFDGSDIIPERDNSRLKGQMERIYNLMSDGRWRTLQQIAAITGDPEASISAQLRNLRKSRFGGYQIDKRHVIRGLFSYRLAI